MSSQVPSAPIDLSGFDDRLAEWYATCRPWSDSFRWIHRLFTAVRASGVTAGWTPARTVAVFRVVHSFFEWAVEQRYSTRHFGLSKLPHYRGIGRTAAAPPTHQVGVSPAIAAYVATLGTRFEMLLAQSEQQLTSVSLDDYAATLPTLAGSVTPRLILAYGPPGTGKGQLATATRNSVLVQVLTYWATVCSTEYTGWLGDCSPADAAKRFTMPEDALMLTSKQLADPELRTLFRLAVRLPMELRMTSQIDRWAQLIFLSQDMFADPELLNEVTERARPLASRLTADYAARARLEFEIASVRAQLELVEAAVAGAVDGLTETANTADDDSGETPLPLVAPPPLPTPTDLLTNRLEELEAQSRELNERLLAGESALTEIRQSSLDELRRAGERFQENVEQLLDSGYSVLAIRCHTTAFQRNKLRDAAERRGIPVYALVPEEMATGSKPEPLDSRVLAICLAAHQTRLVREGSSTTGEPVASAGLAFCPERRRTGFSPSTLSDPASVLAVTISFARAMLAPGEPPFEKGVTVLPFPLFQPAWRDIEPSELLEQLRVDAGKLSPRKFYTDSLVRQQLAGRDPSIVTAGVDLRAIHRSQTELAEVGRLLFETIFDDPAPDFEALVPPYIGAMVDAPADEVLRRLEEVGVDFSGVPTDRKLHAHHVTFAFWRGYGSYAEDADRFNQLALLNGQSVTVAINRVAFDGKTVAAEVSLLDSEGDDLGYLVASGVPHLTLMTVGRTPPMKAIDTVRTMQTDPSTVGLVVTELAEPLRLPATVHPADP